MIGTKVKANGKVVGLYDLIPDKKSGGATEPYVEETYDEDDMTDKETAESSTKRQESMVSK